MTIDMDWLDAARAQQNALMVASCTVTSGVRLAWDPNAGQDVQQAGETVYSGACSLLQPQVQARGAVAGGQQVNARQMILKLPWDTVGIRTGMTVTVTSPDPDAAPAVLTVTDVGGGDAVTCRRLVCTREV